MSNKDFNAFYKPYVRALKMKNVYLSQWRLNKLWLNIAYVCAFLFIICCMCILGFISRKHFIFALNLYITAIAIFCFMDKMVLKNCIKRFRKKYQIKFFIPSLYEQFQYYLWKDELKNTQQSFSIENALGYLRMELTKYKNEKTVSSQDLLILSGITIVALWRVLDDLHLSSQLKVLIEAMIIYVSYKYFTFKLFFFSSKQKNLLLFKQFLSRLRSE